MNMKNIVNLLFIVALGFIIALGTQRIMYWMFPGLFVPDASVSEGVSQKEGRVTYKPGQRYQAPLQEEMTKPLKRDIVFESDKKEAVSTNVVTTDYGSLTFTTAGGSLSTIEFKRMLSGRERVLTPLSSTDPKTNAFVVGLDNGTPLTYTLSSQKEAEKRIELEYTAKGATATITKQFTVFKDVPRIDVRLRIKPTQAVQARIFLPAPFIADADKDRLPSGLVYENRKLRKIPFKELYGDYWFSPRLFGAEDRYFVHALTNDADGFSQRAFFTGESADNVACILEGKTISEEKSWNLSFYCGPKDAHMMAQVDPLLEGALDYGWLSPLVKILLSILKFLYSLVHNYGWAIILLILIIRLLMAPFMWRGRKAMGQQKEFNRKMKYIEQKFKDNPERLAQERLALTKKYGMSNLSGCLPQLITLPILFGLYRLLSTSVELYQAPFILWITDLSVKDPYYILPMLAGLGFVVQLTSDTDMRRGMTMFMFAAGLVIFTANLPAGVTLYLAVSTWLAVAQAYAQKRFSRPQPTQPRSSKSKKPRREVTPEPGASKLDESRLEESQLDEFEQEKEKDTSDKRDDE